jgi:hypothetical protein
LQLTITGLAEALSGEVAGVVSVMDTAVVASEVGDPVTAVPFHD